MGFITRGSATTKLMFFLENMNSIMNFFQTLARGMRQTNWVLYLGVLLFTLIGTNAFADGSRDLYASGTGVRALLRSSNVVDNERWPFPNEGVHYVYATAGEIIALASSSVTYNSSRIKLYNPQGVEITSLNFGTSSAVRGAIANRNAEQAGPKLSTSDAVANRYTPVEYTVPNGGDGIYMVKFLSTGGTSEGSTTQANAATFPTTASSRVISAWDVSVINSNRTSFIKGRVYVKVLNLSNGTTNPHTNGFYGVVYPLTKDGYTYRVDNNGNNGMYFTFLVNNNGFINTDGTPTYKSLNRVAVSGDVNSPNSDDTNQQITHKMFYTPANKDLPTSATGVVGVSTGGVPITGTTWLKNAVVEPEVGDVKLIGVDGVEGQVSNKGGNIRFTAGTQGNYKITITSPTNAFFERILVGTSIADVNNIYWDGKAGTSGDPATPGLPLPQGVVPAKVTVQLQGAEVHFPFIDMEYNRFGTKIQLLDHAALNEGTQTIVSDIVYWDDSAIPNAQNNRGTNAEPRNNSHLTSTYVPTITSGNGNGISSGGHNGATPVNGHIWGAGVTSSQTSGQFGDVKSIDTWTFIKGEEQTIVTDITVKIADLKVTEVSATDLDGNPISSLNVDDEIRYTVKVKNGEAGDNGSDIVGAPFSFTLPPGFEATEAAVFVASSCGSEATGITYDAATRKYSSSLDLENGCEITYTFVATITADAPNGTNQAEATILRPNDVTDPDATNQDLTGNTPPTDPHFECSDNGLGGACNNILGLSLAVNAITDLGITKVADKVGVMEGDEIVFTLTVTNNGTSNATGVTVSDMLPTGLTFESSSGDGTYTALSGEWTIGNLAVGASATLTITVTGTTIGEYTNTATVTATGQGVDNDLTNNSSSVDVRVYNCLAGTDQVPLTGDSLDNK